MLGTILHHIMNQYNAGGKTVETLWCSSTWVIVCKATDQGSSNLLQVSIQSSIKLSSVSSQALLIAMDLKEDCLYKHEKSTEINDLPQKESNAHTSGWVHINVW